MYCGRNATPLVAYPCFLYAVRPVNASSRRRAAVGKGRYAYASLKKNLPFFDRHVYALLEHMYILYKEGAMYNPAIADMVSMVGRVQRDAIGAQIITQTLDAVNNGGMSRLGYGPPAGISNNADYMFQTSVLNAAYSGKGAFVDITA